MLNVVNCTHLLIPKNADKNYLVDFRNAGKISHHSMNMRKASPKRHKSKKRASEVKFLLTQKKKATTETQQSFLSL